jgi:hypothetical protein
MRALQISMRTACLPCLHPHMHPGAGDVHDSASSRGVPPSLRGEEAAEGWEVYCRFRRREEVACALDCRHALLSCPGVLLSVCFSDSTARTEECRCAGFRVAGGHVCLELEVMGWPESER